MGYTPVGRAFLSVTALNFCHGRGKYNRRMTVWNRGLNFTSDEKISTILRTFSSIAIFIYRGTLTPSIKYETQKTIQRA